MADNNGVSSTALSCHQRGCKEPIQVSQPNAANRFLVGLGNLYHATTAAGDNATQYWADIAEHSKSPLAPLANIPGVFAALWTPEVAPETAFTLGTAGFSFLRVPKTLVHFTSVAGARGITTSGVLNATKFGLFGPGAYLTKVGRPLNLFVRAAARTPIILETPAGTARIIPYLVYVRWGFAPLPIVLK
jgi:hypothetical protein